jgi:hypothetical protein
MAAGSIARNAPVIIVVLLLLGAGLLVFAMGASTVTLPPSTSTTASGTAAPSYATTSSATTGSITFSTPQAGSEFTAGQNCTISGTVNGMSSSPDFVFIQVSQQGSILSLVAATVAARSGGAFSFSTLVGASWPIGTYVITATDVTGATGSETFIVTNGDIWIG